MHKMEISLVEPEKGGYNFVLQAHTYCTSFFTRICWNIKEYRHQVVKTKVKTTFLTNSIFDDAFSFINN